MRYTVTATRSGRWWALQCVEVPGALSQARTLAQVPALMREAIAYVAGVEQDQVEVDPGDVQVLVPEEVRTELEALAGAEAALANQQQDVALHKASTARTLRAGGMAGSDVARLLGVSPQRVSQLLASS